MEKMLKYCSEEDLNSINQGRVEAVDDALKGFEALDGDKDGYVYKIDLIDMTRQCMDISEEDIREFFETFDVRQDGSVSKADWEKVFGSMYDDHIAKGLEETFLEQFPGETKAQ